MAASKPTDGGDEAGGSAASSGWSSWLQMAKDKSLSAFDLIKKDLAEFKQTITQDTSKLVSESTALVKDVLTKSTGGEPSQGDSRGINKIVSSLTKTYATYDDADAQPLRISGGSFETFDRYKVRLQSIQNNPATFCTDPDDAHDFGMWLSTFDVDGMKSSIAELLVDSGPVRALYTKLVPTALSHTVFWQRYFYRVHLLDVDEARKAKLKHRADKLQSEKEQLSWPDKDDWDGDDEFGTSPRQTAAPTEHFADTSAAPVAAGLAELTASAGGTAGGGAGPLLTMAAVDGVLAVVSAEQPSPALVTVNQPVCPPAAAATSAADTEVDLVVSPALPSGTSNCVKDVVTVPDSKFRDSPSRFAQYGSVAVSPVTIAADVQMAAVAIAATPAVSLPGQVELASMAAASAVTASAASPTRLSPLGHVEALDCNLQTLPARDSSAEKDSLTELIDLQQDPNVDSDWEKEFDVAEELSSAATTAGPGQTADTDRDLEWETWE